MKTSCRNLMLACYTGFVLVTIYVCRSRGSTKRVFSQAVSLLCAIFKYKISYNAFALVLFLFKKFTKEAGNSFAWTVICFFNSAYNVFDTLCRFWCWVYNHKWFLSDYRSWNYRIIINKSDIINLIIKELPYDSNNSVRNLFSFFCRKKGNWRYRFYGYI